MNWKPIALTEQLPKVGSRVLTCTEGDDSSVTPLILQEVIIRKTENGDIVRTEWRDDEYNTYSPTHWQTLPAAFKSAA